MKKLFITFFIFCSFFFANAFASVITTYDIFELENANKLDIKTQVVDALLETGDRTVFTDNKFNDIIYFFLPNNVQDLTTYVRFYSEKNSTFIFVATYPKDEVHSSDFENLLKSLNIDYTKSRDTLLFTKYEKDFSKYIKKMRTPQFFSIKNESNTFDEKNIRKVKKLLFANKFNKVDLNVKSYGKYFDYGFDVEKNEFFFKKNKKLPLSVYGYIITNKSIYDLTVKSITTTQNIRLSDTKGMLFDKKYSADEREMTFIPTPMSLLVKPSALSMKENEDFSFTQVLPKNVVLKPDETLTFYVLKDKIKPIPLKFEIESTKKDYSFEF